MLNVLSGSLAPCTIVRVNLFSLGLRLVMHLKAPLTAKEPQMIVLGVVLLVIGLLVKGLYILVTIGIILLVIGVVLWILGSMGRAVGGRKHYY